MKNVVLFVMVLALGPKMVSGQGISRAGVSRFNSDAFQTVLFGVKVRDRSPLVSDTLPRTGMTRRSALVGAAIGFAAGAIGGSFYQVGCGRNSPRPGEDGPVHCSTTGKRLGLVLVTGIGGGVAGAIFGGVVGRFLERNQ
ncbi:MAG TPA: hypothetical protein VIP11_09285 [Gemmatimonadaceae bacterium]